MSFIQFDHSVCYIILSLEICGFTTWVCITHATKGCEKEKIR